MKRIFFTGAVVLLIILTTGCKEKSIDPNKKQLLSCTNTIENKENSYIIESVYEASIEGGVVTKVVTQETVTSENNDFLKTFEQNINDTYKKLNETYHGYTYNVNKKDNSIVSNVTIDYDKMDMDKFVTDQPTFKEYLTSDKKIKLEGMKEMYESLGSKCTLTDR